MFQEYHRDDFTISTNPELLDLDTIHAFLARSYWLPGVPHELVVKAVCHSLCFGLYDHERQIGFARVVTDYTHFAYLMDVFVLETYRGRGLGRWLVECILWYLEAQGLRRVLLATQDAHEFYRKCGFKGLDNPHYQMERLFERPWFSPEAAK